MVGKFRQIYLDKVKPGLEPASLLTDKEFLSTQFHGNSDLRLTKQGLSSAVLFNLFDSKYEAIMPFDINVTPKVLVTVLGRTEFPFYIDNERLIIFDTKIIAHLALLEGDLKLWFGSKIFRK